MAVGAVLRKRVGEVKRELEAVAGRERGVERHAHPGPVDERVGRRGLAAVLDLEVREVIAGLLEEAPEAGVGGHGGVAAAARLEVVLLQLHPEPLQGLRGVVGVGDRLGPGHPVAGRVERHVDLVVGGVLPVCAARAAVGVPVPVRIGKVDRLERFKVVLGHLVGGLLGEGRAPQHGDERRDQDAGEQARTETHDGEGSMRKASVLHNVIPLWANLNDENVKAWLGPGTTAGPTRTRRPNATAPRAYGNVLLYPSHTDPRSAACAAFRFADPRPQPRSTPTRRPSSASSTVSTTSSARP